MTKTGTIEALKASSNRIRALGATGLYLYGSASRNELSDTSDVDLYIDYDPESAFSFVELVRLQELLADELKRDVDLTTRNGLHPLLRPEIERTSIKIF
jgi:uncharacterized protein